MLRLSPDCAVQDGPIGLVGSFPASLKIPTACWFAVFFSIATVRPAEAAARPGQLQPSRQQVEVRTVGTSRSTQNTLDKEGGRQERPERAAELAWTSLQRAVEQAIERAEPSVVAVARVRRQAVRALGAPLDSLWSSFRPPENVNSPDFVPNEFGSGVVLSPGSDPSELLVLTNYHVVVASNPPGPGVEDHILVRWSRSPFVTAEIVAADRRSDLAVLRPNLKQASTAATRLKPARLADPVHLRKGQFVVVLGNPYMIARDGSPSASLGIISNFSRFPAAPREDTFPYAPYRDTLAHLGLLVHVDTRLEVGTSGGALVNLNGELVGLTTSLAALEGYEKSAGFAIPFTPQVQRIIRSLMRGLEPEYGFLGIEPTDAQLEPLAAQAVAHLGLGPLAVEVGRVLRGSPADRAGMRAGDYILAVGGHPVFNKYDLMREVGLLEPSQIARIHVWRPGEQRLLTLLVKLGKWPIYDERDLVVTQQRYPLWRGMRVDYPTSRRRFLLAPDMGYPNAVVVTHVQKGSPAEIAGLRAGDFVEKIEGVPVRTPIEFYDVARSLSGPVHLSLLQGREVTITESEDEN